MKDLKSIDVKKWKDLGLPDGLFSMINKMLLNTEQSEKKLGSNKIIEENDEIRMTVFNYLENIVDEIRDSSVFIRLLKNLYMIIENIIVNPTEAKYKQIKANGGLIEKNLLPYNSCMKFFIWVNTVNLNRFLLFYQM